jgi:hypothetical protein
VHQTLQVFDLPDASAICCTAPDAWGALFLISGAHGREHVVAAEQSLAQPLGTSQARVCTRRCCCGSNTQDACSQFNCGANPKRSPAPQLNQGEATADLCCVVPPIQKPQVQLVVPAATCSAADNERLAQETWRQLTQGMAPADAALITVAAKSCGSTSPTVVSLAFAAASAARNAFVFGTE